MNDNGKKSLKLRQMLDKEKATDLRARESWHMLTIMAEFVESTERLAAIGPAVNIFGSARIQPENLYYISCMAETALA